MHFHKFPDVLESHSSPELFQIISSVHLCGDLGLYLNEIIITGVTGHLVPPHSSKLPKV